jgi:BirA family transcriptional regulator, biotin operon repressor / biotin---[acetyl-CoA-carboxylase] ligase
MVATLANEEMVLSFLIEGGDGYVSGAALSDKLGLSRTAVWKHVETLRSFGYAIEAQSSKGYRLLRVPDRLSALELGPLLSTRELGQHVIHFESVPSTNQAAFEAAQAGAPTGTVFIAEAQTAGKGRRGRQWISPAGKNLAMSCLLRPDIPPARASEVTLLAAVAVAEALAATEVEASIKWPNDLLVGTKKIAGILTELSADTEQVHFVVLGIGVNLNADPSDFAEALREQVTSAKMSRGQPVPRALFASALLLRLETWLEQWENDGFEPIRAAWKSHCGMFGKSVRVKSEHNEFVGVAEDIDASGALLVTTTEGTQRVLSADVEQIRSR